MKFSHHRHSQQQFHHQKNYHGNNRIRLLRTSLETLTTGQDNKDNNVNSTQLNEVRKKDT